MSRTLPWFTAAVVVVVLVIQAVPGASAALALERGVSGEPWRWWTGHLSHFGWNHLGWDLAVWAVLAGWLETRSRTALWSLWLASSVAISAVFLWALPDLISYRGLSGLDAALFAAVAVELWRTSEGRQRWLPSLLAVALGGKVAYEVATGHTLFADDTAFTPVPLAHAVGGIVGALVWARAQIPLEMPTTTTVYTGAPAPTSTSVSRAPSAPSNAGSVSRPASYS